jgi:hypothetical protein
MEDMRDVAIWLLSLAVIALCIVAYVQNQRIDFLMEHEAFQNDITLKMQQTDKEILEIIGSILNRP